MKILLFSLLLLLSSCDNSNVQLVYFKEVTVVEVYGEPTYPDFIDVVFEGRVIRIASLHVTNHKYVKGEDILVLIAKEQP